MKEYKEKLKINTVVTAIACVILAVATALTFDTELGIVPFAGLHHDGWRGFVSGVSFGLLIAFGIDLVRDILALRSEEKLKKMLVKDNDERDRQIWNYARSSCARAAPRPRSPTRSVRRFASNRGCARRPTARPAVAPRRGSTHGSSRRPPRATACGTTSVSSAPRPASTSRCACTRRRRTSCGGTWTTRSS